MLKNSAMFPVPSDALANGASQTQWFAGLAMQSLILRLDGIPDSESERRRLQISSARAT